MHINEAAEYWICCMTNSCVRPHVKQHIYSMTNASLQEQSTWLGKQCRKIFEKMCKESFFSWKNYHTQCTSGWLNNPLVNLLKTLNTFKGLSTSYRYFHNIIIKASTGDQMSSRNTLWFLHMWLNLFLHYKGYVLLKLVETGKRSYLLPTSSEED